MVKQLREEIEGLVRKDIIVPSKSPWTSPMVHIRKKGTDRIRLCIDYRRLSDGTNNDPFQMPCIEDLLNQVAGATWLSKLDLNIGFHQVPLSTDSKEKTAFCSPWGKFAFKRMPFGLKNAPAAFQRCMLNALSHLPGCSAAYIDDVIIFSPNWKTHIDHIRPVLDALRVAGLTANPLKCVRGAHSLEYLGHHVGMGKVRVPEVRVRAMKDYVRPTSQKGLRAFLGMDGYYRRFMPDFSRWAGPLFGVLKKGFPVKIEWGESRSVAFVYLTNALSCEHTLTMPREHDHS